MVGTSDAECWIYGTADGSGDLPELTPDAALKTAGAVEMGSDVYPYSAPYLMYAGLNLLVCDLGSALDAGTWIIPVMREDTD